MVRLLLPDAAVDQVHLVSRRGPGVDDRARLLGDDVGTTPAGNHTDVEGNAPRQPRYPMPPFISKMPGPWSRPSVFTNGMRSSCPAGQTVSKCPSSSS